MTQTLQDGTIYGVESYSTRDGLPYYRILHYAKLPEYDALVQCSTRAIYYVERYGRDKALALAAIYDPTFDIFENLENGRKVIEGSAP